LLPDLPPRGAHSKLQTWTQPHLLIRLQAVCLAGDLHAPIAKATRRHYFSEWSANNQEGPCRISANSVLESEVSLSYSQVSVPLAVESTRLIALQASGDHSFQGSKTALWPFVTFERWTEMTFLRLIRFTRNFAQKSITSSIIRRSAGIGYPIRHRRKSC
jgi:hypothetical protein